MYFQDMSAVTVRLAPSDPIATDEPLSRYPWSAPEGALHTAASASQPRAIKRRTIRDSQPGSPAEQHPPNAAQTVPNIIGILHNHDTNAYNASSTSSAASESLPDPLCPAAATSTPTVGQHKTGHDTVTSVVEQSSSKYCLWDGDHPEDVLTEQVIRDGFSSKPKIQNEMGTARSSLWPHLKAGPATSNLSSAFLYALQQRRSRDVVTAASTFKPPPRVTLTDSRKTAWLSELADDNIPLRRLSRTIPHGFRGRALLEQCLQNRVPVARAMWLIRCVGANELRAFRRKGVSDATVLENEHKWISEWTGHVDKFLSEPLRERPLDYSDYHYALQLAARIFAQGLVHRDEFLGRLCERLLTASIEDTPFALIKITFWFSSIALSFRHCFYAAQALFRKFQQVYTMMTLPRPLLTVKLAFKPSTAIQRTPSLGSSHYSRSKASNAAAPRIFDFQLRQDAFH